MSNFEQGGGGYDPIERYNEQRADGSVWSVEYNRETGEFRTAPVALPPPRESPDDVNMPYGGAPPAQGIGVNWGDQDRGADVRQGGGGGRPWWHFWKPGESPDTEPAGRGAGLASPPMSPPVPTNDYLGEGGYTPPPVDPFDFPRDKWTPSNQSAPSGPAGTTNLRTTRPPRYDFEVQRRSDVPSPAFNPVYDSTRNPTDPYYNPRGQSGNSDQFTPDMLPFYPSRPQAGTSTAPPRAGGGPGGGGGPSDQTPPEHLPFYPAPGGTNQRYGLPPQTSASGGGTGGGEGGNERPAGWSAADAQWEQEFRYAHQGMGPAEFYKQPNNWKDPQFYAKYNRYPTDAEAMAWALADRQWGDALFRERGFAPTFSDWMQNYGAARSQGYPVRPYPGMANQYRGGGGDLMAYSGGGAPARPGGGGHWVEGPNGIPVWQD